MKCPICRTGQTGPGKATVTLERDGLTLVVRGVPARVCRNCGEEYVEESEASKLLAMTKAAAKAGIKVDIRDYVAT